MAYAPKNYGRVDSIEEFEKFCDKLIGDNKPFAFDIETGYHGPPINDYSIHPETAFIVGFSFSNDSKWARYVPLAHDDYAGNLDNVLVAKLFWRVLNTGFGIPHQAKFELRHLAVFFRKLLWDDPDVGAEVRASNGYFEVFSDTIIEAYLAAEQRYHGLKALVKAIFGHQMVTLIELFPNLPKNKEKTLRFNILQPDPHVVDYGCEDSAWTMAVHEYFYPKVKDTLLYKVETQILPILCEMEDFGVKFDWAYMREACALVIEFMDRLNTEIQAELSEMVGEPVLVNLSSPVQLGNILYERLGMRTTRYTKSKKMSTDKIALNGLSYQFPTVKRILQWKELRTLVTRYLDKFEKEFSYAEDGMTHPDHKQTGTISGRFSVNNPNYQQLPKKYKVELSDGTVYDFNFRNAVIAPANHYIIGMDYSQVELRAFAGEAQEPALLEAFEKGIDVHIQTAAMMLRIPVDAVDEKKRQLGKTFNFSLLFGLSPKSLSERMAISLEEAEELIGKYFATFSSLAAWKDHQVKFGHEHGYVLTKFGRKIPIWEFESTRYGVISKGERLCVNGIIQGSASGDVPKIAMIRAHKALKKAGLLGRVHLSMNIHDALEYIVHKSVAPQDVIKVLEPAVIVNVPGWPKLEVAWHVGLKWGTLKEVGLNPDGSLWVGDVHESESLVGIVDDEDGEEDEEETIELPEVDISLLKSLLSVKPESVTDGKVVIVSLSDMPDVDAYSAFLELARSVPGSNAITMRTPIGSFEVNLPEGTSLSLDEQSRIAMILPGAKVGYDSSELDPDAIVGGLEF